MPINQLIAFCDNRYDRSHSRSHRCTNCQNNQCENSCISCLDLIHKVTTNDRTYNCENIIYCYTCKYLYRYSTEIELLLDQYVDIFRETREVRMWSIGCGPCSELFGLYNFKIGNDLEFVINYKGFDLSTLWKPVHEFIKQRKQFETNFIYGDIFQYSKQATEQPDIIVLNYVISDILRTNRKSIDQFITSLCNYISQISKCVLIINDINLGRNATEPRFYYDKIIPKIKVNSNISCKGSFHFVNSQTTYYKYGIQHSNNKVPIIPPGNINTTYAPWLECRSAQLFILKQPR